MESREDEDIRKDDISAQEHKEDLQVLSYAPEQMFHLSLIMSSSSHDSLCCVVIPPSFHAFPSD